MSNEDTPNKDKREKKKGKGESTIGRAQFENMINEDTSSSEQEEIIKIKRVGYIEMKRTKNKKVTWKAVHCVLYGGSFFWYKDAKEVDPLGYSDLKNMEIENNVKVGNKDCFVIKDGDDSQFTGVISSETSRDAWVSDLVDAKTKDPNPPPSRDFIKNKKQGAMSRAKNRIITSTATSALGKKVMKAIINEETTSLLTALKNIVKVESNNPKKAEDLEKNIIKIAVKSYLLIEKNKINPDDFLRADKPLRSAFELLCRCFNGRHRVQSSVLYEALVKIETSLRDAEEILTNLLAPFLTSKNLFRLSSSFGILADAKFLSRVFSDTAYDEELEKLVDAMEYYTQFHYT
jgi:hypothetical protein